MYTIVFIYIYTWISPKQSCLNCIPNALQLFFSLVARCIHGDEGEDIGEMIYDDSYLLSYHLHVIYVVYNV